jgi:hypothetical protein
MHCAASNCRCKSFKKHTWTVTFTHIIYRIRFWRLQRRIIYNGPRCRHQQALSFYALQSSLHSQTIQDTLSVQVCLCGIVTSKRVMKIDLLSQSKAKLLYQHDLTTDILDRKHSHIVASPYLSDKILCDDLIENKIRSMNESTARRNLFTLNLALKALLIHRASIVVPSYESTSQQTTSFPHLPLSKSWRITSCYETLRRSGHLVLPHLDTILSDANSEIMENPPYLNPC